MPPGAPDPPPPVPEPPVAAVAAPSREPPGQTPAAASLAKSARRWADEKRVTPEANPTEGAPAAASKAQEVAAALPEASPTERVAEATSTTREVAAAPSEDIPSQEPAAAVGMREGQAVLPAANKAEAPAASEAAAPAASGAAAPAASGTVAQLPPLVVDLPSLLARAADHEAKTVKKRANDIFRQTVSNIDVTAEILPDFVKVRADCLKQAEQEVGESGGASIERMRKARAAMLEAAKAFADSVFSLGPVGGDEER